jgi:Protein of unknown function (DUF4242)
MPKYLAELYVPLAGSDGVRDAAVRARSVADEMTRNGTAVRFLRSIFVPGDETCFLLYEASSPGGVAEATRRAGMELARISEAVDGGPAE